VASLSDSLPGSPDLLKQFFKTLNYLFTYIVLQMVVNGGVKVRRVADQNRGTQALFTPLTAGCQTFFIS